MLTQGSAFVWELPHNIQYSQPGLCIDPEPSY